MSDSKIHKYRLNYQSRKLPFESTADIEVPDSLIKQVIGQKPAVEIIKLAARQKRFVMLMGEPGTGKSMLGEALTELLPAESLVDLLSYPNPEDPNVPRITSVPTGKGQQTIAGAKQALKNSQRSIELLFWTAVVALGAATFYLAMMAGSSGWYYYFGGFIGLALLFYLRRFFRVRGAGQVPKLLVNNYGRTRAPFVDATGAHEGALFGDVRHDPYQSGGSETSQHQLVEVGAIHRAHGGVLYIDEVSTLGTATQQALLTAIQKRAFPIAGRSPGSSGTMVRTAPVPCDFILVLAGNIEDLEKMHPALRSRVRGYGYEILTRDIIDDIPENHENISRFVAQEVIKDKKIPHFSASAVQVIIREAHKRAGVDGKLTGKLRDLGGLVRAAGDVARTDGQDLVLEQHVETALAKVKTIEEQLQEADFQEHTGKKIQMPRASA